MQMRQKFQSEVRNLTVDLDSIREQFEEEQESKSDIQRQLTKSINEISVWKVRFETEGTSRTEELMESQRRLQAKLMEAEQNFEAAQSKTITVEKAKARLAGEMEDLMIEVERQQANSNNLQKRQRQFDVTIKEWQSKVTHLTSELEVCQQESRSYSAELFKIKSVYEETSTTIESLRRENKNLSGMKNLV